MSCSGWSLRQDAFAPNPIVKFTVHLLQTASPADNRIVFSRELRRRNHDTVYIELLWASARKRKVEYRACVIEPREVGTLESGQRLAGNVGNPCLTGLSKGCSSTGHNGRTTHSAVGAGTLWGRIGTFENEPNAISIVESVGPVQQQLMVSPRLIKAEPHRPD